MLKTILEYVICYSFAFGLGVIVGVVLGFYTRGALEQTYDDNY